MPSTAVLKLTGPYDLRLSLKAAASFLPAAVPAVTALRVATHIIYHPTIIEVRQTSRTPPMMAARSTTRIHQHALREIVRWLLSAELDLRPFYRIVTPHPVMGVIAKSLRGLKPLRPVSLFEMAIIAITEQQLSLAAAFHIRTRLIEQFGTSIQELWIFPTPAKLANASLRDLRACGLSRQKAEYVRGIAEHVAKGDFDLDALKRKTNAEAYDLLISHRGFGDWSARYILARGLGRQDCLPSGDTSLRYVVGRYLAHGRYLSPDQLEQALSPFAPFRGLAAFYLSVAARIQPVNPRESGSTTRL
jgi:DNA-3-methyladenine glycosylase II